uniref:Uncharacterized protein n=1 Tax=Arundo donax TaxID=35708 RepID=A0A0A8ZLF2_ARUDO
MHLAGLRASFTSSAAGLAAPCRPYSARHAAAPRGEQSKQLDGPYLLLMVLAPQLLTYSKF